MAPLHPPERPQAQRVIDFAAEVRRWLLVCNVMTYAPDADAAAIIRPSPICGAGAENTVNGQEVYTATVSAVSLRPKFSVLDVKVLPIRKDGSMACPMFSTPSRPFRVPEKRQEWFLVSTRSKL
jgi:hypothetical protein